MMTYEKADFKELYNLERVIDSYLIDFKKVDHPDLNQSKQTVSSKGLELSMPYKKVLFEGNKIGSKNLVKMAKKYHVRSSEIKE